MNRVVVDETVRAKLNGLNEQLELWDESGHQLGHYLPADAVRDLLRAFSRSLFSDEEVQQAKAQPRIGKPLVQILQHLGSLE